MSNRDGGAVAAGVAAAAAAPQFPNRVPILIAAMTGMTMQMLDTTIANVALPHMAASLSATQDTISWVLTSYVLAAAVAMPLTGWLVDRVGTRLLLLGSVTLFTIASALCGAAQNIEQMVLFRVMQGLAGAFLSPLAQTIMLDLSTPEERPRMMTIFTQAIMIGPIAGPVIGGYLTDNFDWRWVFYVNLPVGALCIALVLLFMPAGRTRARPFDLLGWALIATTVSALQLMLDRGTQKDWFESGEIVAYAVLAVCAGWMTVVHVMTGRHPLFSRGMFADRNLVVSLVLTAFFGVVLMSTMALLPSLLQTIYGYPPVDAGLLLTPRGFGMLASITLFGKMIARADPRLMLGIGFACLAGSLYLMSQWGPAMPVGPIIVSGVLQGVGMSLSFVPLNLLAFATLPAEFRTDGTSIMNLLRNLGSAVGITLCTVFLGHSVQVNHAEIGERFRVPELPFAIDQLSAYNASETALRVADALVNKQAAMIGYNNDFFVMALAAVALLPMLLLLKRPQALTGDADAALADAGH